MERAPGHLDAEGEGGAEQGLHLGGLGAVLVPEDARASGSSARRRSSTFMSGAMAAIFASSPALSKVVKPTPAL